MLGPDNTVTPARANLDQQENMIRRGRREEKTETKRDRKSIIAENPKPTKHYKNSGFRQLSRTLWLEHQKQSILEKAATKIGFWGRHRIQYVYSGFVDFVRKRKPRIRCLGKASLENVPFSFSPGVKLSQGLFGTNPIFSEKVRFQKPLRQKALFLPRNLGRA